LKCGDAARSGRGASAARISALERFTMNQESISRRGRMEFNEIRKMAKGMGINAYRMKKKDLIQAIQKAESNIDCFGTQRVEYCQEHECLWREDCQTPNRMKSQAK
jgi:hypothetical protein